MSTVNDQIPKPEWRLKKFKPEQLEKLGWSNASLPMQKALANLELESSQEVEAFLRPSFEAWTAMESFESLDREAERVWQLVQEHQPVCIHGDFDTDGLCAMTILRTCLEVLGIEVFGYLPHRGLGHGISLESLEEVKAKGAKSIITVDCGISAQAEALQCKKDGIPLIITDHHLADDALPEAEVIINPQLGGDRNSKILCGAGVSLKLALELSRRAPQSKTRTDTYQVFFLHAIVLAAIATIGDVMPLLGNNRSLVKKALSMLPQVSWPGLKALVDALRLNEKSTAEDLAFQLIPRLNSAQRLEQGELLKELVECRDEAQGKEIVSRLNTLNLKRREMQEGYAKLAMERVQALPVDAPLMWVEGDEWLEGFSGLMASRLCHSFAKPAVVLKKGSEGDLWQASCRAPEGYHLKDALDTCSERVLGYGGHAQAAGFRVEDSQKDALKQALEEHFRSLSEGGTVRPQLMIIAEVPFREIKSALLAELEQLEPYGHGNRKPLLATKGLMIDGQPRLMGAQKTHVSFRVFVPGSESLDVVAFGMADEVMALDHYGKVDIVYYLGRSPYNQRLQLQAQGVRQHQTPNVYRS